MLADTCGQVDDAPLSKQLLSIVTNENMHTTNNPNDFSV